MADLATAYLRLIPSLQGAQRQIEKELAGVNTSSAGRKSGASYGEGVKGGIKGIAIGNFLGNILTSAATSAASMVGDVFADAFNNFAEFEQLEGGVEKIFDQADTSKIFSDAQNAYKELNMSANQYLDSINQVGATFAQTMGDQAGYDTARQGMMAIADFASGTGRNLDELNEKYKLITRSAGGYQSIADQFAGVLPQTSADFLKQAQAAGLVSKEYEKLTEVPVEEYQKAVTAMLEKGVADLGLTQNALNESTQTLSGSIAMTQAAWQNLLTEFGKPDGDIEGRVMEFVNSIGAVFANALPVVQRVLDGIGQAISTLAMNAGNYFLEHRTEIYDKVGEFIKTALTAILQATPYVIEGIVYLVGSLIEYVLTHIPEMAQAALEMMLAFAQSIVDVLGPSMEAAEQLVNSVLDTIGGFFNDMFNAGANLIQGLIDGILSGLKPLGDALGNVGQFIVDHKGPPEYDKVMLTPAGADIVGGLIKGMDGELPQLKSAVGRINGVLTAQASSTVRTLPGGMQVLGGGGNVKAAQMLTVILELDKTPFARAVYQLNDEETQRVGVKLAGGFA